MKINNLTEKITIEILSNETNENGFDEEAWSAYYKCWSSFKSVSGKEYVAAKATQSENVVTFTVRYCKKVAALLDPGATKNFRLVHKNSKYDIEFVSDFQNAHQWVDIKAKAVV